MGEASPDGSRRNPRHQVDDQLALEIVVRRHDVETPLEAGAKLIDVSRQGLKLSLSEPLTFHETIDLEVRCDEPRIDFAVTAEVKWLRRNDDTEAWIIGCSVSNQIPDEFFEEIAAYGAYDRRSAPRIESTKRAVVRWEARQDKYPVGIVNLSSGGFCISSPEPGHIGTGLMLELENSDGKRIRVTAKARWQVEFDSGYLIGCESPVELTRGILTEPTRKSIAEPPLRSLSVPSLIGIVVIAFLVCALTMIC